MEFCKFALDVIEIEAQAVASLNQRIDKNFDAACKILLTCQGRVVVTGMGKSGHIARKIAATLASTGTPAFFLHPAEASHGDFGMITSQDVLLAISNSGNTHEIVTLLPLIKRLAIPMIGLTGNPQSSIAEYADVHLDLSIQKEACPLGLAPTTSTTVALVMGDAIAIALLQAKGFQTQDFARVHPGGSLGKKLLLRAEDIAHQGHALPVVHENTPINEALIEVTEKKLGMTCVVDQKGVLVGVYTDGDIRRTLTKRVNIQTTQIAEVMTPHCKTIKPGMLAAEALALMQQHHITSLIMVNENSCPIAVLHLHDLLRAGVY